MLPIILVLAENTLLKELVISFCYSLGSTLLLIERTTIDPLYLWVITPRTYNIICISSESCLGSNVGFARLPCFAALRSAILAKVAQGELLQLCPGSSG